MIVALLMIGVFTQQALAKSIVQEYWAPSTDCIGDSDYRERLQAGVCYPDPDNSGNIYGYAKMTVDSSSSTYTITYSSSPTCDTADEETLELCSSTIIIICTCNSDFCSTPVTCSDEDLSSDLTYSSVTVTDYTTIDCTTVDSATTFTKSNSRCNSPDLPSGVVGGASDGYVGLFYYPDECDAPGAVPYYTEEYRCSGNCFFGTKATCSSASAVAPVSLLAGLIVLTVFVLF